MNSMEFEKQMRMWSKCIETQEFHGISWHILWNSIEIRKSPFQWHQVSMDFHGLFHGFSCNCGVDIWNETKVRCNSMEHSMEFHGTVESANQISARHWIPWMSKIPRCHHFKQSHGSMHFLRLFLVLPWEYENQVPSTCVEYFMESWSPRI